MTELSRRTLVGGGAGAFALALVARDLLSPAPASAAVVWNHPFTTRYTITADGGYENWAQWRQDMGLGKHSGIDLNAPSGRPLFNCAPGDVTFAGTHSSYGNLIKVGHADGTTTWYAHLSAFAVSQGDTLDATTQIGNVGSSGDTTGPHLHLMHQAANGALLDPTFLATAPLAQPGTTTTTPMEGTNKLTLAISRIVLAGVGEHYMFASPARVALTKELSTLTPALRNFETGVMQAIALAAGYPAGYTPPLIDDTSNGGWYLRDRIAQAIAGMPIGYALSPTNPWVSP